jgi:biopolymer transport protein ExbB/TolQ
MIRMLVEGGDYAIALGLLAVVVLVLAVKKSIDLFGRTGLERERLARGIDAILFWGCISAVLGFMGQFSGHYKSLTIIRNAEIVNPRLVAEGIRVSLITTVLGLVILAISAIAWFVLRCRLGRLTAQSPEGRSAGV